MQVSLPKPKQSKVNPSALSSNGKIIHNEDSLNTEIPHSKCYNENSVLKNYIVEPAIYESAGFDIKVSKVSSKGHFFNTNKNSPSRISEKTDHVTQKDSENSSFLVSPQDSVVNVVIPVLDTNTFNKASLNLGNIDEGVFEAFGSVFKVKKINKSNEENTIVRCVVCEREFKKKSIKSHLRTLIHQSKIS